MKKTQLTKTIELVHSKSGHYKTTLYSANPLYYNVVTKVNYLTVLLWIQHVNTIIKNNPQLNLDLIIRPNWMIMIKSYRRDFLNNLCLRISTK